VTSLTKISRS